MKTISERIIEGLALRGMKQAELVEKTGIGKSSISTYISGAYEPKQRNINKIAKALDVNEAWLMGNDVPIKRTNVLAPAFRNSNIIPVLGSVPAGIPIEAIEDIVDYEEIDSTTAAKGEFFGLKIKGSSMEPRICEGDVVIVQRQSDCESGDIAIVMVNGDNATCKRLMKYEDGIRLLPNNPAYEPMYFTNDEIASKPIKVIGKVIENRQKY